MAPIETHGKDRHVRVLRPHRCATYDVAHDALDAGIDTARRGSGAIDEDATLVHSRLGRPPCIRSRECGRRAPGPACRTHLTIARAWLHVAKPMVRRSPRPSSESVAARI